MALQSGYATVAYANVVNINSTEWGRASVSEKEYALSISRNYIDSTYTCSTLTDPYPDEVMTANSMLADQYLKGNLFKIDDTSGKLVQKEVKAGPVTVKKEYAGRYQGSVKPRPDQFPEVTTLISGYCTLGGASFKLRRV